MFDTIKMRIQQYLPYPYSLFTNYFRTFPDNIEAGFDPVEEPLPPVKPLFIGMNLAGFDSGNATVIQQATYSCISDVQIEWVNEGGVNIVRCPIIPAYIFKEPPTATTPYSPDLFSAIWTDGGADAPNVCGDNNQVFNVGTYMSAVKYLLSKGVHVIIDAHENVHHLCTFGGQLMSAGVFVNMWRLIATYILSTIPGADKVWFELFNEPVPGDNCPPIDVNVWNQQYVVPAIQAIREVETSLQSTRHFILATTYGNYSGLQAWAKDGTLQTLVNVLKDNGFADSDTSKVVLACHQYCDQNFSGGGEKGCDPTVFNPTLWNEWIELTNNIVQPVGMKWFMSEGNVNCGYTENCAETNGGLYIDFLNTIVQNDACLGFAVWMSNLGDNYNGANMGAGPESDPQLFNAYKVIYPHLLQTYNFRPFFL